MPQINLLWNILQRFNLNTYLKQNKKKTKRFSVFIINYGSLAQIIKSKLKNCNFRHF